MVVRAGLPNLGHEVGQIDPKMGQNRDLFYPEFFLDQTSGHFGLVRSEKVPDFAHFVAKIWQLCSRDNFRSNLKVYYPPPTFSLKGTFHVLEVIVI